MASEKGAYPRTTSMEYIAKLIESGDALFRQDTTESIAEATQMYLLADQLLGARPEESKRGYRATVSDRLSKIRSGMNIEGVARPLPRFHPPIDPALLVRAPNVSD